MKMFYSDKRIWIEDEAGRTVGEIDFLQDQNGNYDIVHTGVDPSQQGKGTAGKLVQAAADYIRSTGHKTSASCSYASAWLRRHAEYHDIYEP